MSDQKPFTILNVRKAICPYCDAGLPDERNCDLEMFVHFIPQTSHRFYCLANEFRYAAVKYDWYSQEVKEK